MKSFKNFYIRNNNLVQLQNTSFESPLITANNYTYYGDLSLVQKQNFKWTAGGNLLLPQGPILINNIAFHLNPAGFWSKSLDPAGFFKNSFINYDNK